MSVPRPLVPQPLGRSEVLATLIGLMLGVLMSALDNTVVGTAMPRLIRDLHGLDLYSWPFTAYLLTSTLAIPIFGTLADQLGRRTIFLAGLVEFIFASALCGWSPTMESFIVFRGLQGLGGGILVSNAFALAAEVSAPERRGAAMGMVGAMFGIAGLLGPSVGGFLADGPGWRWAFYINLPLGVAALAVLAFGLRHVEERRTKLHLDPLGLGLFLMAVTPLLLALSWGGRERPWTDPVILGLLAASVVFLILFVLVDGRSPQPLLPPWLFESRDFNLAAAGIFLGNVVFFGAILFLPLWIQQVLGVSASASGLVMTPLLITYTAASIASGTLMRRFRSLGPLALGAGLVTLVGGVVLLSLQPAWGTAPVVLGMVILGLGLGANTPIFSVVAQNSVGPRHLGKALATSNFFRNLGAAVGSAVMGSVFIQRLHEGLGTLDWGQTPEPLRRTLENAQVLMNPAALQALGHQVPAASQAGWVHLMGQIDDRLAWAIGGVFVVMVVGATLSLGFLGFLQGGPTRPEAGTSE